MLAPGWQWLAGDHAKMTWQRRPLNGGTGVGHIARGDLTKKKAVRLMHGRLGERLFSRN